jgi:hypothetical protein
MPQRDPEQVCVVCREAIEPGAKKCTHCSSYQGWIRHVFDWSGVITAALAIVPAWGIAVSLWTIAFSSDAEIAIEAVSCSSAAVQVAARNTGGQPGLIADATIRKVTDVGQQDYKLVARPTDGFEIVPAGELIKAEYRAFDADEETTFPLAMDGQWCRVDLAILVDLMSEGVKSRRAAVSCPCAA